MIENKGKNKLNRSIEYTKKIARFGAPILSVSVLIYGLLTLYYSLRPTRLGNPIGIVAGIRDHFNHIEPGTVDEIELILVHGIGEHCIGYSRHFTNQIASELGYSVHALSPSEYVDRIHNSWIQDSLLNEADSGNISYNPEYGYLDENCDEYKIERGIDEQYSDDRLIIPQRENFLGIAYRFLKSSLFRNGTSNTYNEIYSYNAQGQAQTCAGIRYQASLAENSQINENCFAINLKFRFEQIGGFVPEGSQSFEYEQRPRPSDIGFINVREYEHSDLPTLRIVEVLWDPVTAWIQRQYLSSDHELYELINRSAGNSLIKQEVINQNLSDAMAYIGELRPLMQFPLLQAMCLSAHDNVLNSPESLSNRPNDRTFNCLDHSSPDVSLGNDHMLIVSHSLGSRMVFDVLGLLTSDTPVADVELSNVAQPSSQENLLRNTPAENYRTNQSEVFLGGYLNELSESGVVVCDPSVSLIAPTESQVSRNCFSLSTAIAQPVDNRSIYFNDLTQSVDNLIHTRDSFIYELSSIYTLANQVPLIQIGLISHPFDNGGNAQNLSFGVDFFRFLDERKDILSRASQVTTNEDPSILLANSDSQTQNSEFPYLNIVGYTDPNDLLSYDLRCWFYTTGLQNSLVSRYLKAAHVLSSLNLEEEESKLLYTFEELSNSIQDFEPLTSYLKETVLSIDGSAEMVERDVLLDIIEDMVNSQVRPPNFILLANDDMDQPVNITRPNSTQNALREKVINLEREYDSNMFNTCTPRERTSPFSIYASGLWAFHEENYGFNLSSVPIDFSGFHLPLILTSPSDSHSYFERDGNERDFWDAFIGN